MDRLSYVIVLCASLLVPAFASANLCSCSKEYITNHAFDDSDLVFLGRANEVKTGRYGYKNAQIQVLNVWKGEPEQQQWIHGTYARCALDFEKNRYYMIYAQKKRQKYYTHNCLGSFGSGSHEMALKYLESLLDDPVAEYEDPNPPAVEEAPAEGEGDEDE